MLKKVGLLITMAMLLVGSTAPTGRAAEIKINKVSISPRILLDIYSAYERGQHVQLINPNIFMLGALSNEAAPSWGFTVEIADGSNWVARVNNFRASPLRAGQNTYNTATISGTQTTAEFNTNYLPSSDLDTVLQQGILPMGNFKLVFRPNPPNSGPPYVVSMALFAPKSSLERSAVPVYPRDVAINTVLPTFNWMPATNAANYEVVVGPDVDPENNAYWRSGKINAMQIMYDSKARALRYDKKYYWKVIAYNTFGQPVGGNRGRSQAAWFKINSRTKSSISVTPQEADRAVRQVLKDPDVLKVLQDYVAVGLESDSKDIAGLLEQFKSGSAQIVSFELQ